MTLANLKFAVSNNIYLPRRLDFIFLAEKSFAARRWFQILLILAACLLILPISAVHAEILQLNNLPVSSLGKYADFLVEEGQPLTLAQAQTLHNESKYLPSAQPVLNFGIGASPVWVHLDVINSATTQQATQLVAGATWIDHLDVYLVQGDRVTAHWQTGDKTLDATGMTPALGYVFPLSFTAGHNDIYLRVESIDPMVLPIELLSDEQINQRQHMTGYIYGFIYGFLIALFAYNFLLFVGLGERSYLYYSLYLISVILCNFGYTGHGLAWLWHGHPDFQQYIVLILMVVLSCCGLLFADRFLALRKHKPIAHKLIQWFSILGISTMVLCLMAGSHLGADLVAFVFMGLFTVFMFCLGVITVYQGYETSRYFLVASFFGMLGSATTVFAVWGLIPFSTGSYHALELGLILEATLLALALSYRIRYYQKVSEYAEQLARLDPLTGLYNRRAFIELATPVWSNAERNARPLSVIMMDIDHFKQINDGYGHDVGDTVLLEVSRVMTQQSRRGDILARWGGEEFILLLPETDLTQASAFAERLRQATCVIPIPSINGGQTMSASFGVAERVFHSQLDDLIRAADTQLYQAKKMGRNRVSYNSYE